MDFVPFDATEEEVAARQVLRPGVPAAMWYPLVTWIWNDMSGGGAYVSAGQLHAIENVLDFSFNLDPAFVGVIEERDFRTAIGQIGEKDLLRTVDLLLHNKGGWGSNPVALKRVLLDGRSQYEVVEGKGRYRLASRLPEGVQVSVEHLMTESDTAGLLLRKAWSKTYDIEPDPTGAYAAAVKAVEAAALPRLGISKATATISDAVRAIEGKEADWRLPFKREHSGYPSREVLLGMLKSLYRGQRDRHGSDAYSDVTPDEAEAALLMAVALVGLFARGLVQQRDVDTFG